MKYLTIGAVITTVFLTNCGGSHSYPININKTANRLTSNNISSTITLSNQGTICAYKPNANIAILKYYPLSTSCAPSSTYSWKLNGLESKIDGEKLEITSYSLYKKNNSPIATTDCAGAGVKIKKIATPTSNTTLYWGNSKLTTITVNKDMVCFKRVGNSFIKVPPIQ